MICLIDALWQEVYTAFNTFCSRDVYCVVRRMTVIGGLQLANPNVQRECMKALQADPVFSQLLENFQNGVRPDFVQLIT
jgi:hypothetical protein